MEEKQVYVSFENEEYKLSKAGLLMCKMDLINLQKHITRLAAIRSAKRRLIAQLSQEISSVSSIVLRIDEKMPDKSLPKRIKNKVHHQKKEKTEKQPPKEKIQKIIYEEETDFSRFDKELLELNSKIKSLTN
jgi:hypothetical protein